MVKIVPVPVRSDNYAYLIIDEASKKAAAVDPYDVSKVQKAADEEGVKLVASLTTHHHYDHSGGNADFAAAYPDATIYGGSEKSPKVNRLVGDNDTFSIADDINVRCLHTPCHTQDSICYYVTSRSSPSPGVVFTGDTLFTGGCGRFFEGTGAQMHVSLSYLGTLPPDTIIYNGHEYTAGNLAFAKNVDPENPALERLQKLLDENAITTGRSTIADEKEWNVFMRLNSKAVRRATNAHADVEDDLVMDTLRELKNNFKG